MVRAKFKVSTKTETDWGGVPIKMSAVFGEQGEDSLFGKATPNGQLEMTICNPYASKYFVAGHKYYINFSQDRLQIMDPVICKFKVTFRAETDWGGKIIKMYAEKNNEGEDEIFGKSTPSGQLEMAIVDPAITNLFNPGSVWYMGFHDVETLKVGIGG